MSLPEESLKFADTLQEVIAQLGAIRDVLCRAGLTTDKSFLEDEAFHRGLLRELATRLCAAGDDPAAAQAAVDEMERTVQARRSPKP